MQIFNFYILCYVLRPFSISILIFINLEAAVHKTLRAIFKLLINSERWILHVFQLGYLINK